MDSRKCRWCFEVGKKGMLANQLPIKLQIDNTHVLEENLIYEVGEYGICITHA